MGGTSKAGSKVGARTGLRGSGATRTATLVTVLGVAAALGAAGWMTSGGGSPAHEAAVDDEVGPAHETVVAQETIEVPLTLTAGRLAVPVSAPNGRELTFFVSTGSTVTVLTESTARRVGEARALDLAGVPVPLEGAQTLPDRRLSSDGVAFDGIVGVSTLNRFDVLFDVPSGRMLLREPGPSTDWPGTALSQPARVRVYHGVVIGLDVEIDGRGYAAMLDLGTSGLVVSGDVALDDDAAPPDGAALPDRSVLDEGSTASLHIGTGEAVQAPVRVGDIPMLDRWDPNGSGFALVGAVVARDCALSVSWVHREIRRCVR